MLPKQGERVRIVSCGKGAARMRVGSVYTLWSDAKASSTRGKIVFKYVTDRMRIVSSGAVEVERVERASLEES